MKLFKVSMICVLLVIICSYDNRIGQVLDDTDRTEIANGASLPTNSEEYVPPTYYNYSGGPLPADIVNPIEYMVEEKINTNKPVFSFKLHGQTVQSYRTTFDQTKYYLEDGHNKVKKIVIECSPLSYHQELLFRETEIPNIAEVTYGFELEDWNFDGYLDISLWKEEGGTSLNAPHYYWLWDKETSRYISNKELESISEGAFIEIENTDQELVAHTREPDGYYEEYYVWEEGQVNLVRTEDTTFEEPADSNGGYTAHIIVKERIAGEMTVTEEYYKE